MPDKVVDARRGPDETELFRRLGGALASKEYIGENPDVIRRFAAAVRETGALRGQAPRRASSPDGLAGCWKPE